MQRIDLYPSTIYIHGINDPAYIAQSLDLVKSLANTEVDTNKCSVRNGWQSKKDLYNIKHFSRLADRVLQLANLLLDGNTIQPYISAMWLNVHDQGGFNHVHVHSGAWYSGVFYLQCSDQSGNITFTDPRPGAEMSFYHQQTKGKLCTITPQVGDLILFPGYLPHLVEPNCSTESRISVSFNIELNL